MRILLSTLVTFCLIFMHCGPVLAEAITLERAPAIQQVYDPSQDDYWTNTTYAFGGAALGNGALVLSVFVLDILPLLWGDPGGLLIENNPWILPLLLIFPMVLTPLLMHFNSPSAETDQVGWSIAGSILSVALHTLLVLPLLILFPQENLVSTLYFLAPAGVLSGILIEGLGTAYLHQIGSQWQVSPVASGSGLQLTHQIRF